MAAVSMDGHVVLDDRGVAWIEGSKVKVVEVVLDKLAYGWSPDEIHRQHPTLSLSQIHAAFAYYYDHQNEMDAEIDRGYREYLTLRTNAAQSPGIRKLRALGHVK